MNGAWRVYFSRRMAVLLALGFAAGLPSVYKMLGSTMQAWLLDLDYDIKTITLFGLVSLPLALNFVWAPLMDRFALRLLGWGRRRSWLILVQAGLVAGIAAMAMLGPAHPGDSLRPLVMMGLVVAFLVASQDVVADAYRVDVLSSRELGAGAALFVQGYRLGMVAAGGGALWLAEYASWRVVYLALAALMGVGLVATALAPEPTDGARQPATLGESVIEPVVEFARRHGWWALAVLVFVLLFKLPDAMANAMTTPLLLEGLAFSKSQVALVREVIGLGAMAVGAILGGVVVAAMPLRGALLLFGLLQAASNLGFFLLAAVGRSTPLMVAVVLVEAFCAGLVAAGFIAFLMGQCNRRYSATQYALFTSLMYFGGSVTGAFTGHMKASLGYELFFVVSVLAGLPGLALLGVIRMERPANGDGPRST